MIDKNKQEANNMPIHLSKSKYCFALQCPKMLWLKELKPEAFDGSVMNESVLETGNEVGDLAMGLFGDFTEVPFGDLSEMIALTQELIDCGTKVIAEASFSYDGLFCSVDILKNLGGKDVEIYEVKSSTSVTDIYLHDATYQSYVLSKLGYNVRRICIVHINSRYVRNGELDLQELFQIEDITEKAAELVVNVAGNIDRFTAYMQQTEEPCDKIGLHCFDPYSCGFFGYCTRELPKPNIFDISGARTSTKLKCYDKGLIAFSDLIGTKAVSANQMIQVEHEVNNSAPYINKKAISEFLSQLSYPIYFLDFESFQPAIPLYDHARPYEQIVFQYSLHYIETEGGALLHKEHLAYPGADPRRALAEQLCRDIPKHVCVTAYNMGFEKGRIKGLAELYPDLAEHLMNIHDNIFDLMVPFQKKQYYTRAMQGSYSIKYVLPALFPDDPSLDYHNLEGVHNGIEASDTFKKMAQMSPDELETYRSHLLAYCGLDTYAMVKVWQKLCEVANEESHEKDVL